VTCTVCVFRNIIEGREAVAICDRVTCLFVLAFVESLLSLGLTLSLVLTDKLWGAVLDELALVVETGPLGKTVRDVHDTLTVEHVASGEEVSMMMMIKLGLEDCIPRLEVCLILIVLKVDQAGEEQDHVSTLVHDGTVAEGAADLAGKLMLDRL
jgi:hypothetical protein